jgi:uncharacterized protein
LDATWIHPESYEVARRVLEKLNSSVEELAGVVRAQLSPDEEPSRAAPPVDQANGSTDPTPATRPAFADRATGVDIPQMARELGIGEFLLQDMLTSLAKPGRDPRDDLPSPVFRTGIVKLEDLRPGMELSGSVLNVVDFGAFVDIGISDSALVHISRLADRFVRDPHDVVSVGDTIKVWVLDVDKKRRRVSLTAVRPDTQQKPESRSPKVKEGEQAASSGEQHATDSQDGRRRASDAASRKVPPPKHRTRIHPRKKKKRMEPITEAMVDGREPMRSCSDLVQYYEKKEAKDRPQTEDESQHE